MTNIKQVYILAKNEIENIEQSISTLRSINLPVTVLDSGSDDGTIEIARGCGATVKSFNYINHCISYNKITKKHEQADIILILDADMIVNADLIKEIEQVFALSNNVEVVLSPIDMYWDGRLLKHSSLCPPKPIAFRGGRTYFEPVGHGERLKGDISHTLTKEKIVHDDRKELSKVLINQVRYSKQLVKRASNKNINWRDRVRSRSPLMILITPIYCYFFKLGFLDGKAGIIYALDRLIAETLCYRASLSSLMEEALQLENDQNDLG